MNKSARYRIGFYKNIRENAKHSYDTSDENSPSPCKSRRTERKDIEGSCQMTIDNSANVLKIMRNLYHERLMCDICLIVGKKEHLAHKLILCATSDVFQAMLMKPEWSEWHESKIVLQELPQCERVFHKFLEYFYTGKIIITHTNAVAILSLADKYIVKSLVRLCLDYMLNHIAHAAFHNVLFSWLRYTMSCGHQEVADNCFNYIKWNLCAVANTPDFSDFDVELLISLLQQNDIIVYSEIVLYNFVVRWLDLQQVQLQQSGLSKLEINQHMNQITEAIMIRIRFPMMSPRDLADLLLSPLIKQNKEFFVERMAIGMAFQSGQKERIEDICQTEEGRLLFTPRLYTSDCFSAVMLVENIKSLPSYHTSTFLFSSHMTASEFDSDRLNEWIVDLYPKGVWFQKCYLIFWHGPIEVPEEIIPTVRLSLTCREIPIDDIKVRVGILLYAQQGGIEYVIEVLERVHYFNSQNRILNIDNIIPFEELNPPAASGDTSTKYLIGPSKDQLKINIVITPLCPST